MIKGLTIFIFAALLSFPSHAGAIIPYPFDAHYSLTRNGSKIGETSRRFHLQKNGLYRYHSKTRSTGALKWILNIEIEEKSWMQIDNESIKPIAYNYQRTGNLKNKTRNLQFDWNDHLVTAEKNGKRHGKLTPIENGTLDKMAFHLAIMRDLSQGKTDLEYQVAVGPRVKTYHFRVAGEETLNTVAGKTKTLRIERVGKKFTFWLAPELAYLPVKIEHEDNGMFILKLDRYKIDEPAEEDGATTNVVTTAKP